MFLLVPKSTVSALSGIVSTLDSACRHTLAITIWSTLRLNGCRMGKVSCITALMRLVSGLSAVAQTQYFPPRSLDSNDPKSDDFLSQWYSAALKALDEPSLWELSKSQKGESYRFLWLRTFHHPVSVRIDIRTDGSSQLTMRITSGAGGYGPGHLVKNTSTGLTKVQTNSFLSEVKTNGFWQIESPHGEPGGCDGAEWIIEGVRDGTYRIVSRWSPTGGPVRGLGLFMLKDLAGLKIPADEIY